MKTMKTLKMSLVFLGLMGLGLGCHAAEPEAQEPTSEHRCALCGMVPAKYPPWITQAVLGEDYFFFDGAKCMFRFLLEVPKYAPGRAVDELRAVYVKDYYTLKYIDGQTAYYVTASDVLGPMGLELIPFELESDAREFMGDHGGTALVRFDEVDAETIAPLLRKK